MTEISQELADAYDQVEGHVLELHGRWGLFLKLYRDDDSYPVATGSELFWLLGRLVHRGAFQLFRQLTDPSHTGGRANASLPGLLNAIGTAFTETDHIDLLRMLPTEHVTNSIRTHANKYVSHLDLDLLAGRVEAPTPVELQEMADALVAIANFTNEIGRRFFGRPAIPYREKAQVITVQAERMVETSTIRARTGIAP